MLSSKSYLLRALYEWILDSRCTPHIVVDALLPGVEVPREHVKNGQIVLNVAPGAIAALAIDKDAVAFSARFSGAPFNIRVPMYAVIGIYARENGQGMMFEPDPVPDPDPATPDEITKKSGSSKPALRVVK